MRSVRSDAQARFVSGTIIANRYRIVTLLGRGGMGEVYKADDLKLGHAIALKFMPDEIAFSARAVTRFQAEVRIARQVSHPNVCRVHDVGEVHGLHFLTMEFIDGEDLRSLLRRIGRLPGEKAIEITRQICAGLAAAHTAGVIHRDLKPANVMIDARGRARLTDFGVAAIADDIARADGLVGTPAYMAPEQAAGGDITIRSDIYSLSLVVHELFTGTSALDAGVAGDESLDAGVAHVIARCLERDPARRPASAIQVATALPGGDLLNSAMRAGETPSPEIVAAAGGAEEMRLETGIAWIAAALIGLLIVAWTSGRGFVTSAVAFDLPPEVLASKARELLMQLDDGPVPKGTAFGFAYNEPYAGYVRQLTPGSARWTRLSRTPPSIVYFWYRESPEPLIVEFREQLGGGHHVQLGGGPPRLVGLDTANPPPFEPGMRHVVLDPQGHLLEFGQVVHAMTRANARLQRADWTVLLACAHLSVVTLKPAIATWKPAVPFDDQQAWTGAYADQPDLALRVEGASYFGKPVAFRVFGSWEPAGSSGWIQTVPGSAGDSRQPLPVFGLLIVIAAAFAWVNVRAGRVDRRGAFRLAVVSFALRMAGWSLTAPHVAIGESVLYRMALSENLYQSMTAWVLYLAIEPYVRRRWPQTLISWSRALTGRLRDPLVGRDLAAGTVLSLLWFAVAVSLLWIRGTPSYTKQLETLLGARQVIGLLLLEIEGALEVSVLYTFGIVLFRVFLRRQWAAIVVAIAVAAVPAYWAGPFEGNIATGGVGAIIEALLAALLAVSLTRFGLTAVAAFWFVHRLLILFPTTLEPSSWYLGVSIFTLGTILAVVVFGCYAAIRSQLRLTLAGIGLRRAH